ncbi:Sip1-related alpha-galactosidase [Paenibacillus sp. GCM10023248]|uniref:Sip1-related alpha-galactosidase n=1 Tax=unclassified Paenibacillus TaxID=185978 RepID=UPI002378AC94|nr:Sip1-related alpha-galactosidase [Paenibacillus sp. MAHUQ-63]MDD9265584.1 Sip1-related alpha-galactosidase [Paenibacillus sp. MAHUQ-63]
MESVEMKHDRNRKRFVQTVAGEANLLSAGEGHYAPDERGIIYSCELELPAFEVASYFAPFQKYDPIPGHSQAWPDGCNRIQPLAIHDFEALAPGGHFLLLKLNAGGYMALLAAVGPRTFGWFAGDAGSLMLNVSTFGTQAVQEDVPLLARAVNADPYTACREVWETAIKDERIGGTTRLREQKRYPEPFRYLGWCSWEEYKFDINEAMLLQAADRIEASGLPIRYMLVDDGHLHADARRRLISFRPDAAKFPDGWAALTARRSETRIQWMGLWLNFNGYWGGVAPDNEFGGLNRHLEPVPGERLQPKNSFTDSFAFYDSMIRAVREAGFDFVKVDNQAQNVKLNTGTDNGAERAAHNAQGLEAACARHLDGLINCMAHNAVCAFNTRISAVTRCSEDYAVGDQGRARRHLHNSYGNIPWIGQTVWGDHDMFHSNDEESGQIMAISKAMSGGPIYLSDNPSDFNKANIMPLCYADGELLRPLAPAAPIKNCLFLNPLEGDPYVVIAPLAGAAAALVVYNLTEPAVPVRGVIRASDYADAGSMLQNGDTVWSLPPEGLVLYDWQKQCAGKLTQEHHFELGGYGNHLYLITPVQQGWSAIGRIDKYLSPAAVELLDATPLEMVVRLKENGPFAVWHEQGGTLKAEGWKAGTEDGHLWLLEPEEATVNRVVRIHRVTS